MDTEKIKCSKCKVLKDLPDFISKSKIILKQCVKCRTKYNCEEKIEILKEEMNI